MPMTTELSEWLGILQVIKITIVTMVTKITWGFFTQSIPRPETHAVFPEIARYFGPILTKKWNAFTNFSKTPQYQIS
jgi:hypothetical protein